jgi:glycosyltransferase involved in cell wall biosynthesis
MTKAKKTADYAIIGPTPPWRGGISHYTALMALTLSRSHRVEVFSFSRLFPKILYPGRTQKDETKPWLNFPSHFVIDTLNPLTWLQAGRRIISFDPKVAVIHWWTTFLAPSMALVATILKGKGTKVGFLIHNTIPHETRWFDPFLARLALGTADFFIVQSRREEKRLRRLMGSGVPSYYVPIPPYFQYPNRAPVREDARARLGLSQDAKVVLFFGFVREYKGLRDLMGSFALLDTRLDSWILVIAGEFWEDVDDYRQLASNLGIIERVVIHDRYVPDEEVGDFFRAADVFVAPYRGGTQSAASSIARAFGLPTVVTEAIVDSNEDRENNLTVGVGDLEAMASAIRTCASLPPDSAQGSDGTREWSKLASVLEEVQEEAQPDEGEMRS